MVDLLFSSLIFFQNTPPPLSQFGAEVGVTETGTFGGEGIIKAISLSFSKLRSLRMVFYFFGAFLRTDSVFSSILRFFFFKVLFKLLIKIKLTFITEKIFKRENKRQVKNKDDVLN